MLKSTSRIFPSVLRSIPKRRPPFALLPYQILNCFGAKPSRKEQLKQDFQKERALVDVPKEVDLTAYETACKKVVQEFDKEVQTLKPGKLTPQLLSKITISVHNQTTPISQLGQIIPINATSLSITPFESRFVNPVAAALQRDKLNDFTVVVEGEKILVSVPAGISKEKKAKMVKILKEIYEDFKEKLRQIRHKEMESEKKYKKFIEIDAAKAISDEIQRIYDKQLTAMEDFYKKKEKEFL